MNAPDPLRPAEIAPSAPPPRRAPSPVLQTLLVVGIGLAGLLADAAILRTDKKSPATQSHEEGANADAHAEHGHDEKHAHEAKGRVELTPEKLRNAHLGLAAVGPATVHVGLRVFGKIVPNEEKLAHVSPRFAGIVRRVNKRLGESVAAGEVLATVESNESLQAYDLKAPLAGTIIERSVSLGEFVGTDKSLFTVADLGTVWVDFQIYQQDFPKLRVGLPVRITTDPHAAPASSNETVPSTVAYLSPFGAEHTQTMLARAYVANPTGHLRPGLFVTGEIAVDEVNAPLAVREAAVQTLDGKEVVFVEEGDGFEARPVELGRRDGDWAEVRSGLQPGDRYVAANSFLLKAEIGKEGAEHED